jgi:hypothetical protein
MTTVDIGPLDIVAIDQNPARVRHGIDFKHGCWRRLDTNGFLRPNSVTNHRAAPLLRGALRRSSNR